jgi:hypothetical protein
VVSDGRDRDLERGPTGDHGQDGTQGDKGERGEPGEPGRPNSLAVIGFCILAFVNAIAFYGLYQYDDKVERARVERVAQLNKVNIAQCTSLQNLYGVLQKSILESDRAIDQIAYYKTHPVEREQAHERNRETLESFRTPPCPEEIVLPKELD